jgi:Uma2 family endonuclease
MEISQTPAISRVVPGAAPFAVLPVKPLTADLPDHTQLPDSDDNFVKNFQEHPQSIILTTSLEPVLTQIHPDGDYCIGQDSGLYWQYTRSGEYEVEAPDWFYVPGVSPLLEGKLRHSYVLWKEKIPPLIAIEMVSGSGKEEKDSTPYLADEEGKRIQKAGKFWVYEQAVGIRYYAIFNGFKGTLDMYRRVNRRYRRMQANARGHYPVPELKVELGLLYDTHTPPLPWLRWWDSRGRLLLTGNERAAEAETMTQAERRAKERERLARKRAQTIAVEAQRAREQAEADRRQEQQAREQAEADRRQEQQAREQAEADRRQEQQAREQAEADRWQEQQARERAEADRRQAQQARERAEADRRQAQQAREQAEAVAGQERQQKDRLAARLRSLGIDPDTI